MISLILGNVGYGKTNTLISAYNEIASTSGVLYFRPSADLRAKADRAESHYGEVVPAITIDTINDIHDTPLDGVSVIFIDDLHYFNDIYQLDTLKDLTLDGIDIYCAARDLDDEGDPIEHIGYVACMADQVVKLVRTCDTCGRACRYSFPNKGVIGYFNFSSDIDEYDALCEGCFYERQADEVSEHPFFADENAQVLEITIHIEDGSSVKLNVLAEIVEQAGWDIDEICDIDSEEGVNRLLLDIEEVSKRYE